MVRADLLDAVDRRLRQILHRDQPFGGLPVVLAGDSFQLPPILQRGSEAQAFAAVGRWPSEWWFHSEVVGELLGMGELKVARLRQQMRQDGDSQFARVLNRLRVGKVTEEDLRFLNQRVVGDAPRGLSVLYGDNRNVDRINGQHIDSLDGPEVVFRRIEESVNGRAWRNNGAPPEEVRLRVGALVSMTTNYRQRDPDTDAFVRCWVNGDTARVVALDSESVTVRLNRTGEEHEIASPEFLKRLHDEGEQVPHWEQRSHSVVGGRVRHAVEARAFQVPVRVAAATTIHKSQGQTLDAAFVGGDVGWNPGLAYVALSRVRSLDGLHHGQHLTKQSFRTDKRVLGFQERLRNSIGGIA